MSPRAPGHGRRAPPRARGDAGAAHDGERGEALHLGLLGTMAVLMPPMAMADEGEPSEVQRYLIGHALQVLAEREPPG